MSRLSRFTDYLIVGAGLLTLIPFHYAIASRSNLAVAELSVLVMFGLLFLKRHSRLPRQYFALALSVFATFVWILISCSWSSDKNYSLNTASIYGIAALLFIGLLVVFEKPNRQKYWLYGYLAIAAAVSLVGFLTMSSNGADRLEIGLILSNAAAGFLLPATLLVLFASRQLAGKKPVAIIAFWVLGFTSLAGFLLTFSRGSWFCFVIAAAFIAWFRFPKKIVITASVIALLASAALVIVFSNQSHQPGGQSLISQGLERDAGGTLHDRKIYAKSAWDMLVSHPIIGAGSGSYRIESVSDQVGASIYSINAHASLLQFGAEFGIVGLILLANVIWQIFRLIKITKQNVVVIGATFGLALHFMVEIDLLYPMIVFLLASLVALSVSLGRNHIGKAS